MKSRGQLAKPEHEVLYSELVAIVSRHAGKLTAIEVLAVASNMVGKLIAMQDQRAVTHQIAMETVARNIEVGNQHVIDQLSKTSGEA